MMMMMMMLYKKWTGKKSNGERKNALTIWEYEQKGEPNK